MRLVGLILSVLLVAGCSGDADVTESTQPEMRPVEVTEQWFEAMSTGDFATAGILVEPVGVAIIAAVESNLRSDELVGLLQDGFPDDLRDSYWSGFRSDFETFSGTEFDQITVGTAQSVAGTSDFISVDLSADTMAGQVFLRNTESGWQIDMSATVGPALVGPLGEYLAAAIDGEHAAEIGTAFSDAIVPGLEAAVAQDTTQTSLAFETEYVRQLAAEAGS